MNTETLFFFLVAGLAVVSGLLVVTRANPIKSVLFLIVNFFCLAVLYLTLQAQFIAVIQIIVYAGAIMVLFLFVIMLLNLGDETRTAVKPGVAKLGAIALAAAVLAEILIGAGVLHLQSAPAQSDRAAGMGTVESVGAVLYTGYLLPFEITSILLLAAMVGVIVLAKKKPG
ncbi:MAG TPA: NADH-quinone oxidoreductase subunit J [Bacteroidota bacterium]|jgi:NADH-quinone oxidoreductase subunit J